ncbi:MAG: RNA methyltransferase [Burkholderiales bacterium]|nr:RNA methyltransferase [Burkholderiales bacterium]
MKTISSRDNPLYKELKQLATSAQARRKAGRTVLDGIHLCEAWLDHRGMPAICAVGETARRNGEVAALLERCEAQRVQCIELPDALFHPLSQVEHGVDILFVIDTPHEQDLPALTESAVLLDNLQDPGNLGSILRSAAAAGIKQVIAGAGTVAAWSPKVLRAGMGSHFLLRIHESVDLEKLLAQTSISVLATSSHARQTIYDLDLTKPVAWLFGHEGQGVSETLLAKATHQVAIPHVGKVESLNVAACAAVCFFEQVRQRLAA